jgi:tetratricopeptide (TPR) repeat protein
VPEIAPADPVEARIITASLLAATRERQAEATATFAALESSNPNNLELQEALAYIEWRKNRPEEAWKHFVKAMDLGSKNPDLFRDFGKMGAAMRKPEAEQAIRKAIEFRPDDIDLQLDLGSAYLSTNKPALALATYSGIKKITPDKAFRLFYDTAIAEAGLQRFEQAKKSATRAEQYAREQDNERLASLTKFLDSQVDREKRLAALREQNVQVRAAPAEQPEEPDLGRPELVRQQRSEPEPRASGGEESIEGQLYRYQLAGSAPAKLMGKLQFIACNGQKAKVTLISGGTKHVLGIDDPGQVIIAGVGKATVEFQCGPQKNIPVAIGYRPSSAKAEVEGTIVSMEFQ